MSQPPRSPQDSGRYERLAQRVDDLSKRTRRTAKRPAVKWTAILAGLPALTGTATYVTTEAAQRAHIDTLKQEVAEQKAGKLRCYCQLKRERGEKLGPKCLERLDAEPAAVGRAGDLADFTPR